MINTYYTDGACTLQKNGVGGAGVYSLETEERFILSDIHTTNNRMELEAFKQALFLATRNKDLTSVYIHSDSAYICNCFIQSWYKNWEKNNWKNSKKEPVKNKDLWVDILNLYRSLTSQNIEVFIIKVKAHSNDKFNDIADKLAVEGKNQQIDLKTWRKA